MNKHSENIILTVYDTHVILKFESVYIHMLPRQYSDDIILQPVEIHLNLGDNRIVGSRGCPVASKFLVVDGPHDRIRIEHT